MTDALSKLKALKLYGMVSAWGELMAETRRQPLTGEAGQLHGQRFQLGLFDLAGFDCLKGCEGRRQKPCGDFLG